VNASLLEQISPEQLRRLTPEALRALMVDVLGAQQADRREHQLLYYKPASEPVLAIHRSNARVTGIGGGNGSSKTSSALVDMIACATGVVPFSLRGALDWSKKLRGPIRCRIVVEDLTTHLEPIILPFLRWYHWSGVDAPGGDRGHWGWIPRDCLLGGDWNQSWDGKNRILRVLYRNPDCYEEIQGESTIVFNSYDQRAKNMASGDYHIVLLDEPPPLAVFRENQARTMRVNGRIIIAMTWPDDPSFNCDWIFDEVYERGRPGPHKDPNIDWVEISSRENRFIMTEAILSQAERWDARTRASRIEGKPVRFANRIHELFTDSQEYWCFACGKLVLLVSEKPLTCRECSGNDVEPFNHVDDFELERSWPVIWVVDPHPRKPHMSIYVAVSPTNELWQVGELEAAVDPSGLRVLCDQFETDFALDVRMRLMDPRMGGQPADAKRERTWLQEFAHAGLPCEPADPSDVGRGLFNEYLQPDWDTRRPRVRIHSRCERTILQLKRFMWDDWRTVDDKSQKQTPKAKYDDYPACWRYVMNAHPDYHRLIHGYRPVAASRRSSHGPRESQARRARYGPAQRTFPRRFQR
jgi:phage terminase large subunit-like protein